jgi:branched-chain amino acid aminotransferase
MLTNTILAGITRETILELAHTMGIPVSERRISIQEVINAIEDGTLTEAFGTGTAAGIAPIGRLAYKEKNYCINNGEVGFLTQTFYNTLVHIQRGDSNNDLVEIVCK